MTGRKPSTFISAVMIAMVAAIGASQTVTMSYSADPTPPDFKYFYFKDAVPLQLDSSRIAVFRSEGNAGEARLRETLEAERIGLRNVQSWAINGWFTGATTPTDDSATGVSRLVESLSKAPPESRIDFASPVLLDENGPVIITPVLLVGFNDVVTTDEAIAILQAATPGTLLEANYARMRNVYRYRSSSKNGFEVLNVANALAQRQDVRFAEPNMFRTATMSAIPNDPHYFRQWGLHNTGQNPFAGINELCCSIACPGGCFPPCPDLCIGAGCSCNDCGGGTADFDMDVPEAWNITTGDPSVIIVVCDEGMDLDHPDLLVNHAMGMDFTGEGGGGFPVNPCDDHATTVAGVIGARMNNGIGGVGLAPNCTLAAARVMIPFSNPCVGQQAVQSQTWVIDALDWAQSIGARVTNHSYNISPSAALTTKFIQTHNAGLVHVAGSGNNGEEEIGYPASLDEAVICTSGLSNFPSGLWFGSNYGNSVDVAAPAFLVWTTDVPGDIGVGGFGVEECNQYSFYIGVSYAAPHVSALAGLILSVNPSFTAAQVMQIICDSAVDLGNTGHDPYFGWGFPNAYNALLLAVPGPGDVTGNGEVDIDDLLAVINSWGPCTHDCPPHSNCIADVSPHPAGNCIVDIDDLLSIINNWG